MFYYLGSTKLQYFQYRLYSRRLTMNHTGSKYDKMVSDNCTFCTSKTETVQHLMIECEHVKRFKRTVYRWCNYILNIDLNTIIDNSEFLLNSFRGQHHQFINCFLTALKQYIYATKCLGKKLNALEFLGKIHEMYDDEKFHSKNSNTMYKFLKKWGIYHDYCTN